MWGKCHPTDCDWGEESTTISDVNDNQLSLEWNQGFVIRIQKVTYLDNDLLRVEEHSHYIDDSGRPDRDDKYYFIKKSNLYSRFIQQVFQLLKGRLNRLTHLSEYSTIKE